MKKTQTLTICAIVALLSGCDAGNNTPQGATESVPAIPTLANVETNQDASQPTEGSSAPVSSASSPVSSASSPVAESKNNAPVSSITVDVKGGIDPTKYVAGQSSYVTFSGFPRSLDEFKAAQEKLATTPEGAVVLELMAFEIFCHDQNVGKQCLDLCNVDVNIDRVYRILRDRYDPKYGNYYTPQLVATFLEGATPMNGYKANKPFKVNVRTHTAQPYEDAESYRGTIISLQVQSKGYDTEWRGVSVVKSKGCPYYKVVNNPSMYTQCKPVSFKCDDEYVDICQQ